MAPKEIVKAVRDLLSDPENWTQGEYARTKAEFRTSINDPEACKFCVMGAIRVVRFKADPDSPFSQSYYDDIHNAEKLIQSTLPPEERSIAHHNDYHDYDHVIRILDKVIELNP